MEGFKGTKMRIERQERRSGDAAIYIAVRSVLLAAESWISTVQGVQQILTFFLNQAGTLSDFVRCG
jgi:UDP-glucose 4-epimerase